MLYLCFAVLLRFDYVKPDSSRKNGVEGVDFFRGPYQLMQYVQSDRDLRKRYAIGRLLMPPKGFGEGDGESKFAFAMRLSFFLLFHLLLVAQELAKRNSRDHTRITRQRTRESAYCGHNAAYYLCMSSLCILLLVLLL